MPNKTTKTNRRCKVNNDDRKLMMLAFAIAHEKGMSMTDLSREMGRTVPAGHLQKMKRNRPKFMFGSTRTAFEEFVRRHEQPEIENKPKTVVKRSKRNNDEIWNEIVREQVFTFASNGATIPVKIRSGKTTTVDPDHMRAAIAATRGENFDDIALQRVEEIETRRRVLLGPAN